MLKLAVPVDIARQEGNRLENREAYYGGRAPRPARLQSGPGGGVSACHKSGDAAEAKGRGGEGGGGIRDKHRREKRFFFKKKVTNLMESKSPRPQILVPL